MSRVRDIYRSLDEKVRNLSYQSYILLIGGMAGIGVLAAGLFMNLEIRLLQAITVALVVSGLEALLGKWKEKA